MYSCLLPLLLVVVFDFCSAAAGSGGTCVDSVDSVDSQQAAAGVEIGWQHPESFIRRRPHKFRHLSSGRTKFGQ